MSAKTLNYILGAALILTLAISGAGYYLADRLWTQNVFWVSYDRMIEKQRTLESLHRKDLDSVVRQQKALMHIALLRMAEPELFPTPANKLPGDYEQLTRTIFDNPDIYLPQLGSGELAELETGVRSRLTHDPAKTPNQE